MWCGYVKPASRGYFPAALVQWEADVSGSGLAQTLQLGSTAALRQVGRGQLDAETLAEGTPLCSVTDSEPPTMWAQRLPQES